MASYQKIVLPNSLRVLSVHLPESQTATVLVLVRTGSRFEIKQKNGISHFLEHMLFKGTTKRPSKKEIAELMDSVGASFNAFTSKEYTGYYVKVATQHINLALDVVSDIFINSTIDPKEVEKERRVILEELKMREDLPMVKLAEALDEALYGDQPIGWRVGGTKESVSNITRNDIVDYYKLHYVAPSTTVCFVGPFDHKESLEKVRSYFDGVRSEASAPDASPTITHQKEPTLLSKIKSTDQTHCAIGFRAFGVQHQDRFALELLSIILGGGMSSRLFQRVREEEGLAYHVHSECDFGSDAGSMTIKAGVAHDKVGYAIEAIINELRAVKEGGIIQEELKKGKDQIKGQMALSLESSSDWASFYGEQEVVQNKVFTPQEILQRIDKVTLEDVTRVARDIISNDRINVALVGPVGKRLEKGFLKLLKID